MNSDELYRSCSGRLYKIMDDAGTRRAADSRAGEIIDEITELLGTHEGQLGQERAKRQKITIIATVLCAAISLYIFRDLYEKHLIGFLFFGIAGGVVGAFIAALFTVVTSDNIDGSILIAKEVTDRGWRFSTLDAESYWERWSEKYPFIDSGDKGEAIALRIHGNHGGTNFCYFEYDYTIEVEEEVQYEDSDGNVYYETEYHDEEYTESGMLIHISTNIPSMIATPTSGSKAMKFSYIDLNKRMGLYTYDEHAARLFFDPPTQRLFSRFYSHYPDCSIALRSDALFINFGTDLTGLPRSVEFNDRLLWRMDGYGVVETVEGLLEDVTPLLKRMERYAS